MNSISMNTQLTIAQLKDKTFLKSTSINSLGQIIDIKMYQKMVVNEKNEYNLVSPNDLNYETVSLLSNVNVYKSLTEEQLKEFNSFIQNRIDEIISDTSFEVSIKCKNSMGSIFSVEFIEDYNEYIIVENIFEHKTREWLRIAVGVDKIPYVLADIFKDDLSNIKNKLITFEDKKKIALFEFNGILYGAKLVFKESKFNVNGIFALIKTDSNIDIISEVLETDFQLSEEDVVINLKSLLSNYGLKLED